MPTPAFYFDHILIQHMRPHWEQWLNAITLVTLNNFLPTLNNLMIFRWNTICFEPHSMTGVDFFFHPDQIDLNGIWIEFHATWRRIKLTRPQKCIKIALVLSYCYINEVNYILLWLMLHYDSLHWHHVLQQIQHHHSIYPKQNKGKWSNGLNWQTTQAGMSLSFNSEAGRRKKETVCLDDVLEV